MTAKSTTSGGSARLIDRLIWRETDSFSQGTLCMVLASHPHDEADYIRDYEEFSILTAKADDK